MLDDTKKAHTASHNLQNNGAAQGECCREDEHAAQGEHLPENEYAAPGTAQGERLSGDEPEQEEQDFLDHIIVMQEAAHTLLHPLNEIKDTLIKTADVAGDTIETAAASERGIARPRPMNTAAHLGTLELFRRIATAASAHDTCYIMDEQAQAALYRRSRANEVVVGDLSDLSSVVLFATMLFFPHVAMFVPKITSNKDSQNAASALPDESVINLAALEEAKRWAHRTMQIVSSAEELTCQVKRSWRRQEFVDTLFKGAQSLISRRSAVMTAARRAQAYARQHIQNVGRYRRALEQALGSPQNLYKRFILTDEQALLFYTLACHPAYAKGLKLNLAEVVCDKCMLCEACIEVCSQHAIELSEDARVSVKQAYCTGCAACISCCPSNAIRLVQVPVQDLLIYCDFTPDEKRHQEQEAAKKELLSLSMRPHDKA